MFEEMSRQYFQKESPKRIALLLRKIAKSSITGKQKNTFIFLNLQSKKLIPTSDFRLADVFF
jgi:hypothetical protein